ncbi:MAG: efflux RND transporter periplasmic adaptor subunit [Verrucomicrobiota bacterium]
MRRLSRLIPLAVVAAAATVSAQTAAPGITEPFLDVTVSATVPGTIAKIHAKEGDFVKEKDVVIQLEQKPEELEVGRRRLIWESKVELNAAAEQMKRLKIDSEATRKLYETTKSVSREEMEKKELEYKVAVAEHERLLIAEQREKIEYDLALEQLERRKIPSPLTGYVAQLFFDAGEDCKAQEPLARIVDTRRCYFTANIDARLSERLKPGQTVKLEIDAGATPTVVQAQITFISPVVDPASGLLRVRALFDNPDGKVRPGVAGRMFIAEK